MTDITKNRPNSIAPTKVFKSGNLFGEVPPDVNYSGCSHQDCIEGCNVGKGHCQRLEDAFKSANYGLPQT